MPAAVQYNFEIEANADFRRTITWRDSAGALVNLTGYTARMDITEEDATPVISLTIANSRITLGGALGTIALFIDDADTFALDPTTYNQLIYDLLLKSGSNVVTRLMSGRVTVVAGVTPTV